MAFLRLVGLFGIALVMALPGRADIRDTKHNLSGQDATAEAPTGPNKEEERRRLEREVCVFCHTPDVALLAATDGRAVHRPSAPRWQGSLDATYTFGLFDDIGRAGSGEGAAPVGSVSVACLSCHDSVQAFGVVGGQQDHPFGVPYRGHTAQKPGGAKNVRDRLLPQYDSPFSLGRMIADDSEFRPTRSAVVNQREVYWAAVNESAQRTKNDLPLYPRRVPGPVEEVVPFLECTSCHDPHTSREVFLRVTNEGNQLCLTCHVK